MHLATLPLFGPTSCAHPCPLRLACLLGPTHPPVRPHSRPDVPDLTVSVSEEPGAISQLWVGEAGLMTGLAGVGDPIRLPMLAAHTVDWHLGTGGRADKRGMLTSALTARLLTCTSLHC
jgi:hypothetical protein